MEPVATKNHNKSCKTSILNQQKQQSCPKRIHTHSGAKNIRLRHQEAPEINMELKSWRILHVLQKMHMEIATYLQNMISTWPNIEHTVRNCLLITLLISALLGMMNV